MKTSYLTWLLALIPLSLGAQEKSVVDQQVNHIIDIVGQKHLQKDPQVAEATARLEQQQYQNQCSEEMESHESCGTSRSLAPDKYKEQGWKTIFEIKYQPVELRERRSLAAANYTPYNFSYYRSNTSDPESELKTSKDLEAETKQIQAWYKTKFGTEPPAQDIRTQLIIDQLTDPKFTRDDAHMMAKIKEYSQSMTDQEYARFISSMAGYVDYNDERAAFQQKEGAGLGTVTPFQQMMGTKLGVCGDIHSMAAKIAEQRGWEAFTVGYALEGMQHVVTAMVNPKDPNKLMIVNYGRYEEQALNDGNSITPSPSAAGWEEMGTQMRIFKNKDTGSGTGKMQQIATVPTALGSFMNDLFKKEYQISKAMPANENFRRESVAFESSKSDTKVKKDGDKIIEREIDHGMIVYEGEVDNARIYGVAVSKDRLSSIYVWNDEKGQCVLQKNKYLSMGISTNLVNLKQTDFEGNFYAYLNIKGGQIFHVYETEYVKFKGLIGYELEGFYAHNQNGFLTADGNFTTLLGLAADYNKNGTTIHTALTYEANFGLRNQNLMTDFSSIPKNVNPLAFNAVSLDANMTHKLSDKTTLVSNNNLTMTRVGGRVILSTGIIHKNTSVMASYQGGVKPIALGNSLQQVNLLQNFNNMDGIRLNVSQGFSNKKGTLSGTVSGYGGLSTSTPKPLPMAGASLKVNINGKKKKKNP